MGFVRYTNERETQRCICVYVSHVSSHHDAFLFPSSALESQCAFALPFRTGEKATQSWHAT